MSRRRFLGWEPAATVTDGGKTIEREPEWGETDRLWATALQLVESDTCPGCGQPLSETLSSEAEYAPAGPPSRCKGCDALSRASERYVDSPRPHALRYKVERTDGG